LEHVSWRISYAASNKKTKHCRLLKNPEKIAQPPGKFIAMYQDGETFGNNF